MGDIVSTTVTNGKSGVRSDAGQNTPGTLGLSARGSGLVLPEMQNQVSSGNIFQVNMGSDTTVAAFAKTAFDADQPQLVIDVPAGTKIVPLDIRFVAEDSAGTDNTLLAVASQGTVGAGTSTALAFETGSGNDIQNALVKADGTEPQTACSVYSLYTGNGTAPSNPMEFFRFQNAFADVSTGPIPSAHWNYLTHGPAPEIQGTGALVIYIFATTTAISGYLTVKWLELNT